EPRHAGKQQVENHQVVPAATRCIERLCAVTDRVDVVAGVTQRIAYGFRDRRLVLDNQDSLAHTITRADGRRIENVVPPSGPSDAVKTPSIAWTACAAMASPSPKPSPVSRVR